MLTPGHAPVLYTVLAADPAAIAALGASTTFNVGDLAYVQGPGPTEGYYTYALAPAAGALPAGTGFFNPLVTGGGSGQTYNFTFTPGAPDVAPVFGTWNALYATISALPPGVSYLVTVTGSFSVPAAGMPVTGWNLRGVQNGWRSTTPATGSIVVTIPDGVIIDNMPQLQLGLTFAFAPTAADAIGWTLSPPGDIRVLIVGRGASLTNTGSVALTTTPGVLAQTYTVLAVEDASMTAGPPPSAPLISGGGGTDVIIGTQVVCGPFGGLPNNWVGGNGAALIYQNGADARHPLIPLWVGPAPTIQEAAAAININYDDTLVPPLLPGNPSTVQAAIDALKQFANQGASIVYQPGGASYANVYATWSEVLAAFNALAGFVSIGIDDSLVSPAVIDADSDLQSRAVFVPAKQESPIGAPPTLVVADGNQITNPAGVDGFVRLLANSTLVRPIVFSAGSSHLFELANGARFENAGSVPAFQVGGADQFVLTAFSGSYVTSTGPASVIDLAATSVLRLFAFDGATFAGPNIVTGAAGTSLLFARDATVPALSFVPPFGGAFAEFLEDKAAGVAYDDALVPPPLPGNPSAVQAAIDALKGLVPQFPVAGTLYVELNAPAGGNGSVLAPFNTITDALNAIPGTPSRLNRWNILLGPGYYNEAIALRPWAFLIGADAFTTRLNGAAASMTMPAALWNPGSVDPNETDVRAGFQAVTIVNAQTFDFNVGANPPSAFLGSNEGKLYFTDVISNSLLTFVAFSTINQTQHRHCQAFGGIAQQGMQIQFEETAVVGGTSITIADAVGIPAIFNAFGGATNGDVIVTNGGGNPGASAIMQGFAVTGSITLSGALATYQATAEGISANVTVGGGASLPTTLTGSNAVGYDDALVPPPLPNSPNNVQSAIDALKVEVDNLATSGLRRTIKFPIVGAATTASATNLPAGAFVFSAWLNVTTPDAAAIVTLGQPLPGNVAAFQAAGDNNPAVAGLYTGSPQVTAVGPGALPVLATVVGGTTLVADVIVDFSIPIS